MALTTRTRAQEVGRAYAEAARAESTVAELWVSACPDGAHLWLLTQPIDLKVERHLHALMAALYDRFGGADFQLHILNPRNVGGKLSDALPSDAERIPLPVS